jgi:hypothetical protein
MDSNSKNIERRLPSGNEPNSSVPDSQKDRDISKNTIYRYENPDDKYREIIFATVSAMQEAGYPISIDNDNTPTETDSIISVNSLSNNKRDLVAESALILGVAEATRRAELTNENDNSESTVKRILNTVIQDPEFNKQFNEYYSGLRWGTDQERFTRALFVHGTEYSREFLDENLTSADIQEYVYLLEPEFYVPYDERKKWRSLTTSQLLAQYPQWDYRKLDDEEFRHTQEGQTLQMNYVHIQGEILSKMHKNSSLNINSKKEIVPLPLIPLSKHPVVEAIIINEVSTDVPKEKYFLGPKAVSEIIIQSDSIPAHNALVKNITTRLPRESKPFFFDGPNEFEFKRGRVLDILYQYKRTKNYELRDILKNDILEILEQYSEHGNITSSLLNDYLLNTSEGSSSSIYRNEIQQANDILLDILTFSFVSPDIEITTKALEVVEDILNQNDIVSNDIENPLSIGRERLALSLIDSLEFVDVNTNPHAVESFANLIFKDQEIACKLRRFVDTKLRIVSERESPEVLKAFDERGRLHYFSSLIDESDEYIIADKKYSELTDPINKLEQSLRTELNFFLFEQAEKLIYIQNKRVLTEEQNKLFSGLINRIEFGDYKMRSLPTEYYSLVELSKRDNLNQNQVSVIAWRLYENLKYINQDSTRLLVPVVLDMYEMAFGPLDKIDTPTNYTSRILSAVSYLIRENSREIFKSADLDSLNKLATYSQKINEYALEISRNHFLPDTIQRHSVEAENWRNETLRNLEHIVGTLRGIDSLYQDYLLIEAVKVKPNIYYPWVINKLKPLWNKMQWEVAEGNTPSNDIKRLYETIETYIRSKLVIQKEYPEDFDVITQGNLASFLYQMYYQMVVPHDIKYNTTVWQEGLGFMHHAVAYMPEEIMNRIKIMFPNSDFANYIENERSRWVDSDENVIL